jgi:hypothetical protein
MRLSGKRVGGLEEEEKEEEGTNKDGQEVDAPRPADPVDRPHGMVRCSVWIGPGFQENLHNLHIVSLQPFRAVRPTTICGSKGE